MNLLDETFEIAPKERKKKAPMPKVFNCTTCSLLNVCKVSQMEPMGRGELGIAIVADMPASLTGDTGKVLRTHLRKNGINVEKDCIQLSVIQCNTSITKDKYGVVSHVEPKGIEIKNCWDRVEKQLKDFKPGLIFCIGKEAINRILFNASGTLTATAMDGRVVPSDYWNAWVACSLPVDTFVNYYEGRMWLDNDWFLSDTIKTAMAKYSAGDFKSQQLDGSKFKIVEDVDEIMDRFVELKSHDEVAFDIETNMISPFEKDAKILTASFATGENEAWGFALEHKDSKWTFNDKAVLFSFLINWLESEQTKIIQNSAFEILWAKINLKCDINGEIVDTMVREHILDNRNGICSQDFQAFVRYGSDYKGMVDVTDLSNTPLSLVLKYNCLDVRYLWKWKHDQDVEMCDELEEPNKFFQRAIKTMTRLKRRGIKVAVNRLEEIAKDVAETLAAIIKAENTSEYLQKYEDMFAERYKSTSSKRKQRMFYSLLGLQPLKLTGKGEDLKNPFHCSTDKESMEHLVGQVPKNSDEARLLDAVLRKSQLLKLQNTYISNVRELSDPRNLLHPSFLLHTVTTYRSSSADPNFQNFPVRDPVLAVIRECFVPQNDFFLEADYGAAEVRMIAMVSGDKQLRQDILDGMDFHRYFASLLFEKPEDEITSEERYKGKNGFVFPEFYGSGFKSIARKYPEWNRKTIEKAEEALWARYPQVSKWKEQVVRDFAKLGYSLTPLGFRMRYSRGGPVSRLNLVNSPIQSTAFHRLLLAVMDIDDEMVERGMKSMVVGQVHDSVVIDFCEDERDDVIEIVNRHMTKSVWGWDESVPMVTEIKIGKDMLNMKEIEI